MMAQAEICDSSTPVYYSNNRDSCTIRIEPLKAKYTGVAMIESVKVGLL